MKKLTFEKAILIVFAAIVFISTTEIREKYIDIFMDRFSNRDRPASADVQSGKSLVFPTMLLKADTLYKDGDYEGAEKEYLAQILNSALSTEQKSRANFRLGICQYHLKKYEQAFQSFLTAASFSPYDSIIYNNAAVSAYRAKDMESAIEYQTKALNLLPAVEYYYNLARMYEDNEEYDLAVKNYLAVSESEQNLSKADKIDPVRVKEKVARLFTNNTESEESKVFMAYKLNTNISEVLTVNENEMQLKSGDFTAKVENRKDSKKITAEYDRKQYDPYNLITEMLWTVYKDGKQIYKKSSEKISVNVKESGNYEVRLNIKYSGKEKISSKTISINNDQSIVDKVAEDNVIVSPPVRKSDKTYEYAVYEQLFEDDFNIDNNGYTDKFDVVWGRDSGIDSRLNKLAVDKLTSLVVENQSYEEAGLWVNLDSLLKDDSIKGKTVTISFYAREITDNADLDISVRVKSNNMIVTTPKSFKLAYQFEQKSINVYIPEDANGFTLSIKTKESEQFNIDRFVIVN